MIVLPLLLALVGACKEDEEDRATQATKQPRASKQLEALPYLVWNPTSKKDRKKLGITKYVPSKAYRGMNIYKSREEAAAYLMDMEGHKLHKWTIRAEDKGRVDIKHVEINDAGELFAVRQDKGLIKVDWQSKRLWQNNLRFHHDVYLDDSGDIYALTRRVRTIRHEGKELPILDDCITVVSAAGETKRRISIYDMFGEQIPEERLQRIAGEVAKNKPIPSKDFHDGSMFDVFHSNTVEKIERDVPGLARAGQLLTSIRELDTVAVVDLDKEEVVWSWGPGELEAQHQPTLLSSGKLLIFDNGRRRRWTRVIELDPATKEIGWRYEGKPRRSFFSAIRGGNERLPNGNTLITESDKGHVFEVTPEGEIVWDFWNPRMKRGRRRAAIYRMMRLDRSELARLPLDDKTRERLVRAGYLARE